MATKTTKMEFYVISNDEQSAFLGFRLDENLVMQPCKVTKIDDAAQFTRARHAEYSFNHPGNHQFCLDNDLVYSNKINMTTTIKCMAVAVPFNKVARNYTPVNGITEQSGGIEAPVNVITGTGSEIRPENVYEDGK